MKYLHSRNSVVMSLGISIVFAKLRRLIAYLREHWSNSMIILRGDSHFCSSQFMDWAHGQKNVEFLTGLTGNSVLNKYAKTTIVSAQREFKSTGKPEKPIVLYLIDYQITAIRQLGTHKLNGKSMPV